MMQPCLRRQKLVTITQEGKETSFQCVNRKSVAFAQAVDEGICAGCPVRMAPAEPPPCKQAPAKPEPIKPPKAVKEEVEDLVKGTPLEDMPIKEMEGVEEGDPEYPALSMQLWLYKEALGKWKRAGYPVRTDAEVKEIHEKKCKPCNWYDADKKRCKGCGCKVTIGSVAVFNKIKMATEHCPKGEW